MDSTKMDTVDNYEFYEKELDRIILELENGTIESFDKLIENYEYGSTIIKKCEKILKDAELRVQKIMTNVDK